MNRYKLTVGTNYFDVPTSLECEGVIKTIYVNGTDENDAFKTLDKKFPGKYEFIKVELV